MKIKSLPGVLLAIGLIAATFSACVSADKAALEARAKITRADAEKTALTKAPGGKVKEAELEEEKGKLVWSFDIAVPGTKDITEVLVDAVTGEIVAVEKETPEDQKKEKEKDKK